MIRIDLQAPAGRPGWVRVLLTEFAVLVALSLPIGAAVTLTGALGRAPVAAIPDVATIGAIADQASPAELAATKAALDRATRILAYGHKYDIDEGLSAAIYDIARDEGIQPELAYRLVKVESNFRRAAQSERNAVGFTQVRLIAAREYMPEASERDLRNPETNLRVGFRYLRDLLRRFDGNLELALVAYNRGPTLVDSIASSGGDPMNGYPALVLAGVRASVRAAPLIRKGS